MDGRDTHGFSPRRETSVTPMASPLPQPSGSVRQLIVNADDYGLTDGVNRAIEEAHANGVVTSTTVLVSGGAAAAAGELPARHPGLDVGLHVNLTLGRPASDPARIPTLVDADGSLLAESVLLRQALRRRIDSADVYREVLAQARALRELGVTPSHWDGHRAVAFWPWFRAPAARAAEEAGIRRVRSPRVWVVEPGRDGASARRAWRLRHPRRLLTDANRRLVRSRLRGHFAFPAWRTSPSSVVADGGDAHRFALVFANLPEGSCELVTHPGHPDAELEALTPGMCAGRAVDYAVLTDPALRERLAEDGVELIGFHNLPS
jgi:chitin disaccharide deacetylase